MTKTITQYEYSEFRKDDLRKLKGNRKIIVVFSTFGEREARLIYDKISLLRSELGDYIDGILISHHRSGNLEEETERKAREAWEGSEILICNNCRVPDMGDEMGKGADMRRAVYHINGTCAKGHDPREVVLVFLDADVVPKYFGSHFVLALSGALIRGHDFARASFWRELGRIKKFVAQPLMSVIDHPDLKRITDFHYPLSGEAAGTLAFFNSIHFWQRYGVETGINVDTCMGEYRVADVNLGLYDHEHHRDLDIQKMAFGIIRTYLTQLRDYGIIELGKNAFISDTFRVSFIDEEGERRHFEFDLTERKYAPLKEIL
jgi:glucosyl-3-phosphoglycerate synthase